MCAVIRQATTSMLAACFLVASPSMLCAQAAPVSVAMVVDALRKGQNADALRISGELVQSDPKSSKAWTVRAVALERLKQDKQALAAYDEAIQLAPDYLPALEGAAQLGYKEQSPKAAPLLRHIVSLQPANATAHAMLGVLEYRQGDYAPAAEDFAAAEEAVRSQPDALMAYSICLARLNRAPEAIAHFQELLTVRPADAAALFDLALVQWHSGAGTDALATLGPLLNVQSADASVLRLVAAIHEESNETPQAIELLRTAIARNPDDPSNYVEFATLSFMHGSYSVGVNIVELGLTRLPNSAALYMARGVLYGQNGDFEQAMSDFEHAHKLDPRYTIAATAEGIAQSQRHNHEAALQDFRREVQEHPNNAFAHYLLAEALSWAPPEGKRVDATDSLTEAIAAANKAIALDPRLVQAYDLLGSLYLQANQPDLAVKTCRAAIGIMPKDQQAVYTLILALRKTGAKDELKGLVQTLTALRKQEQADTTAKNRYGQMVEAP